MLQFICCIHHFRFGHISRLLLLFFCAVLITPTKLNAQVEVYSKEDLTVSYLYSVVMGSGTYKIHNRRITMFRMPFSYTFGNREENESGWKLLLPTVIGYDDLSNIDSDWVGNLLPSELVTFFFVPGAEYTLALNPAWQLKPFFQIGAGRDYSLGETVFIGQFGLRSLNYFEPFNWMELRWGNTLRMSAEYQKNAKDQLQMGILETGVDIRSKQHVNLFGKQVDIGGYLVLQRFNPKWESVEAPDEHAQVVNLVELGLSTGFKRKHKFMGIHVQRVRLGYKIGGDFSGWTIGTEFPF